MASDLLGKSPIFCRLSLVANARQLSEWARLVILSALISTSSSLAHAQLDATSRDALEILQKLGGKVRSTRDDSRGAVVTFPPKRLSDSDLVQLQQLSTLRGLSLRDNGITDEGLRFLSTLTHLEWLDLSGTQVTNKGMKHLRVLTQLESLGLTFTQVSEDGVGKLRELPHLRDIRLGPTPVDLRILDRANAILDDVSMWNRQDNRRCENDASTRSLYCAIHKACVEATGEFQHRQAALEAVRIRIAERFGSRVRNHRLMDFNNHQDTSFADVKSVLNAAAARIRSHLKSNGIPPVTRSFTRSVDLEPGSIQTSSPLEVARRTFCTSAGNDVLPP